MSSIRLEIEDAAPGGNITTILGNILKDMRLANNEDLGRGKIHLVNDSDKPVEYCYVHELSGVDLAKQWEKAQTHTLGTRSERSKTELKAQTTLVLRVRPVGSGESWLQETFSVTACEKVVVIRGNK